MSISKPSYNRHCKGVREIMTDHTAFNPCSPPPPWISSKVLYHCWAIWHKWSTRFDWPSHYFSLPYIFVLWLAPGTERLTPGPTRERTSDVDHGEVKSFKGRNVKVRSFDHRHQRAQLVQQLITDFGGLNLKFDSQYDVSLFLPSSYIIN